MGTERKVTQGRKLRTDGTVVESNIRSPSDNRLLADEVRIPAWTIVRGWELVKHTIQEPFEDFTQATKQLARQIGETLRKKTKAAKTAGRQAIPEITRNDPKNGCLG
jgi:IS5 family transposase